MDKISACKVTFGTEPSGAEIYDFLLNNYNNLKFSEQCKIDNNNLKKNINPKRRKREVIKFLKEKKIGTKSQNVIKWQYKQNKQENKTRNRKNKIIDKEEKYKLRKEKKKQKRKGRSYGIQKKWK